MNHKESLKHFALIVEENIAQRNLMLFVMSRVFEANLQLPTHHNNVHKNIANGGESFTTMLNVVIAGL